MAKAGGKTAVPPREMETELLNLVREMLKAIHAGDAASYARLCAEDLSCFEDDVAPYRIDGIEFHKGLIEEGARSAAFGDLVRFDILSPRVHLLDNCAVVAYTRLMTYADPARFAAFNETRIFHRREGGWRMVHFHRNRAPAA